MKVSPLTLLPLKPLPCDLAQEKPWEIFDQWYESAHKEGVKDPSVVSLATATSGGTPSCRMVLLKGFDEQGFVIYTNTLSRKARDMEVNPQAALCFYWPEIGKQVRIEGYVGKVNDEEADAYFATRSLKSRIGAWASHQSEPMKDRSDLIKRIAYYSAKWAMGKVERPPHWTGFRVGPNYFEFWSANTHQIPERKVFYQREDAWYAALLQP